MGAEPGLSVSGMRKDPADDPVNNGLALAPPSSPLSVDELGTRSGKVFRRNQHEFGLDMSVFDKKTSCQTCGTPGGDEACVVVALAVPWRTEA